MLGPLAVWTSEGRPVRIPELKVRILLAHLLVSAGEVVPADRLIDDMWGDRLPANPPGALQTRVSQLRRALEDAEPGGRDLIVSRAPGYALSSDATVDSARFQRLIQEAGRAGDPSSVTRLLGDALALWRGPALADFADAEFTRPVIARLEKQRLTAAELRAEARLELGEHGLLADELSDLVTRHPLRERLRAVHLRALYRAGRQGEALESYQDLRTRLADELGVDPGPELAALHQAILEQDNTLRPAETTRARTNLPAPVNELIGRDTALAEVRDLLADARLVTLVGPGGVGKTRLATESARAVSGGFPDGTWLVELAPEGPGTRVADAVLAALEVRDDSATVGDRLPETLRDRRMLLVLDNCEHVIEQVAALSAELLRAAPGLHILATSQEPLGISGEWLFVVPPLDLESAAVELFVARANATAPGFRREDDNVAAITSICRRLDGIPLALELAATRVRALGVHELDRRLHDRFQLLGSGPRDAPPRQRTLRAMIDWSWELLPEPERMVLRRLAIHADGGTLAAAEASCGTEVLDPLTRLVDRSLLTVSGTDEPRYRMLESVAAYGIERLREAGEFEEVRRRHREYYTEFAERADAHLRGPEQRRWLRRLDAETPNLRYALDGAGPEGCRLVNALAWYWVLRGRLGEGVRALSAFPANRSAMLWRAGFTRRLGQHSEEPVPPSGQPEDARAEWFMAYAQSLIGEQEDETPAVRSLSNFRANGDQWGTAAALITRAQHALIRSDLTALAEYGEQSMAMFTELGDRWGQVRATQLLGRCAEIVGDYDRAGRLHRDGLRMAEELELWTEMSDKLSELGRIALLTGDLTRADDLHRRALRLAAEHGYQLGEEYAELGLAISARRRGDLDAAETHLRRWLDWEGQLDSDFGIAFIMAELGFVAELRGDAEAAGTLHHSGLSAARRTGDPRTVALAVEGLAGAEVLAGRPEAAARLLGAAETMRTTVGAPLPSAERGDVERITARVRAVLSDTAFEAAYRKGADNPADTVPKEI